MMKKEFCHTALENFPIVGVGASAGGVESFKDFVGAIPESIGLAYVMVLHLNPNYKSMLSEILAKRTTLPVHRITEKCRLQKNHIYVVPENKLLDVTDHTLVLKPRDKVKGNRVIDFFFSSLAKVHKELAMGVVLTGTDGDGTRGLWEIKKNGGTTFAEDPASAEWKDMPNSAIKHGVVDFVLQPSEIPIKLRRIIEDMN